MGVQDNFKSGSDQYAQYRPSYPKAVFEYLYSLLPQHEKAWDCGTGTGQVAQELAQHFTQVFASDISASQIAHAVAADNITYSVQAAEATDFDAAQFDLITVGQAIHWFDFDCFYAEVRRTARAEALLALMGYDLIQVSTSVDALIRAFYSQVLGAFWDPQRRYIDAQYQTLPFPFKELPSPKFTHTLEWNREHLIQYLHTWSAVKHFINQMGYNPIEKLEQELDEVWPENIQKEVHFPILLRIGKIHG